MRYYDEPTGLYYEIKEDRQYAVITDADRKINEAFIPSLISDRPVHTIGKKAFLGCKGLREVHIPEGIKEIGEWAFAFCDNLRSVFVPRAGILLGKGVFKNDGRLESIFVNGEDSDRGEMISRLLAAAPVIMDAEYLLDFKHAGSAEWLNKWDTRLSHILNLADDEGYHLYVLCGEEDLHFDYEQYLEYNRDKKARLCMLRLVNDTGLKEEDRRILTDYLLSHTVGSESEASIRVLLESYGDSEEYYRLMLDTGVIDNTNVEAVLNKMGDRHPQMKAYLIKECAGSGGDFFDDLAL